jgi:Ca2+-binding EF-hand superfamily protein
MEKIGNINAAFRFFDENQSGKIAFNEFYGRLEQIGVKILFSIAWKVFSYLDKDQDGYLNYLDFCHLTEEKVKNIDPFE